MYMVLGFGITGKAVKSFLEKRGIPHVVVDDRECGDGVIGRDEAAGLLERVPFKVIDQSEVGERICLARCLSNVNTPEDFKRILKETDPGS